MSSGIQQQRIKEDTVESSLLDKRSLFEPLVMFFGLTNSPMMFQMMMNVISEM